MTIFNPTNIIFNGKEPNYMVLNGKIIWQKENPYRVEYTISPANDTDTVGETVMSTKIYLPTSEFKKLEIIKNDDSVVINDTSVLAKDVKKIIAHYKETTEEFNFSSFLSTSPKRIKTVEYFNISNFTKTDNMFNNCSFLEEIPYSLFKNDGKLVSMNHMFNGCSSLTRILFSPEFKTDRVTDMSYLFKGCSNLTYIGISSFKTGSVKDMKYMFSGCEKLSVLDLNSTFSTVSIVDMSSMFRDCIALKSISINSLAPSLSYTKSMFSGCIALEEVILPQFTAEKVTDMSDMFSGCISLKKLNLSDFNTSKVTNCTDMFRYVPKNVNFNYIESENYRDWNLTELDTNFDGLFPWNINTHEYYVEYTITPVDALERLNKTISSGTTDYYNYYYLPSATLDNSASGYPIDAYRFITVVTDNGNINTTNIDDLYDIRVNQVNSIKIYLHENTARFKFAGLIDLPHRIKKLNYIKLDNLIFTERMFSCCSYLESVNLSNISTSNVVSMGNMFQYCSSLTSLDLSNFDTSLTNTMTNMFYNCSSLISLDLSNFNTSNVTNMNHMFNGCSSLSLLNLSSFNTRKVTSATKMFLDVPDTVDWCYDEADINSYTNFTLLESPTSFCNGMVKFPWNLTEYFVEYTIEVDPLCPAFDSPVLGNTDCYSYLPTTTTNGYDYKLIYEAIEVTLKDGSVTQIIDKLLATDVKKVKFYYNKNTKGIRFSGFEHIDIVGDESILRDTYYCSVKEILSINTRNFNTYKTMFRLCNKLTTLDASSWNTTNVESMTDMFYKSSNLESINLSTWDTRNVKYSYGMFEGVPIDIDWCHNEKDPNSYANFTLSESSTNYIGEFPWNANVLYLRYENVPSGFRYISLLPDVNELEHIDQTYSYSNVYLNSDGSYFPIDSTLKTTKAGNVELKIKYKKNDTNMISFQFFEESKDYLTEVENLYIAEHWNRISFVNCERLKKVSLYGDTRGITSMESMFHFCVALTEIKGISEINTSNVTNMCSMFENCRSLKSLDLSKWDISKVTDMNGMFEQCRRLELLNLSTWDTRHLGSEENNYEDIWEMFFYVPNSVNWCYDESDPNSYANFTLDEVFTFYDGTFPWNKD